MPTEPSTSIVVSRHRRFDAAAAERVRAYLSRQLEPTLPHDPAWSAILRDGLRHEPVYLEARVGEQTVGVLPLAYVQSFLFGKFLVSLPYLNVGGAIADDDDIRARLLDEAVKIADERGVKYLELRNLAEATHPMLTIAKTSKVLMRLELPKTPDELWKSFKPEVRNQIRKGEKSELTAHWGGEALLGEFYDVFAANMRDLGTPVFSKGLFASMLRELQGRAELCVVRMGALPIAGGLLLHGREFTEVPSASSLREFNKTCSNMLLYHRMLVRAIERGQRVFDFGRSSENSGTYRFKRQWGAQPHPSVWQYYVRYGDVSDARPDNPKYARRIERWKKLPLWLTRLIGPTIIRGVP